METLESLIGRRQVQALDRAVERAGAGRRRRHARPHGEADRFNTGADIGAALDAHGISFHDARVTPRPGQFTPVGIMMHHTGSALSRSAGQILRGVQRGVRRRDGTFLPGPLCNVLIDREARTHLVSVGRVNGAGHGDQAVLARVRRDEVPVGNATRRGSTGGGRWFFNIEIANTGKGEAFPAAVSAAAAEAAAALCDHYNWGAIYRVIGHKEWTSRKADPAFDMVTFRNDVAARQAVQLMRR